MNADIPHQHIVWITDAADQIGKLAVNRIKFGPDDVDAYLDSDPPFKGGIRAALSQACQRGICAETDDPDVFLSQRFKEGI